ncbi:MAG: hypothetical protein IH831_04610 [Planctomycetes bacterium]|nr:hypothetical protein [Planctomycetota bacterium]
MMILAQVESWPVPLLEYLASQHEMLLAHARHDRETMNAYFAPKKEHIPMAMMPSNPHFKAREHATRAVLELLQFTTLRGWHCTRLTRNEVEHITTLGMQPPNLQVLQNRIRRVQPDDMFEDKIAERLIEENQAGDSNRNGMIWFCFFEPRITGQSGIERLFRSWGGEALYNSHERDPQTGKALQLIGRPCLIEADVPISSFSRITNLGDKVIRRYLLSNGYDTGEEWEHEDRAHKPIPAANIVRFVFHGESEFAVLTGCDSWEPPLDG